MRRVFSFASLLLPVAVAVVLVGRQPRPGAPAVLPRRRASLPFRTIRAGVSAAHYLSLNAGEFARITVDQRDIDLCIDVRGPGTTLPEMNGSAWGREEVSIVAYATGVYEIDVTAEPDDSVTGRFSIAVEEVRPARAEDYAGIEGQLAFFQAEQLNIESAERRALKERLYREAAARWQSAGDLRRQAQALNRLGRMAHRSGRYADAQRAFEAALRLWNQLGDEPGRLETLKLLANLGAFFGEERAPIPVLEQYLAAWTRLGDRRAQATIITSISSRLRGRDNPRSIAFEKRGLKLREALGNRRAIGESLDALAEAYSAEGSDEEGLRYAQRSLELQRELADPHGVAAALSRLAFVLERKRDFPRLEQAVRSAMAIYEAEGDLSAQASLLACLARAEARNGDPAAALESAGRAMSIEQRLSAALPGPVSNWAFQNMNGAQSAYVMALLGLHTKEPANGHDLEALLLADRARGRFVAPGSAQISVAEIRRALDPDTVLIEYLSVSSDEAVAWMIWRDRIAVAPIPEIHRIPRLAWRAFELMNGRGNRPPQDRTSLDEYEAIRAQLGRYLLGPVAPALAARRILIVSDESFAFLPFAPLPDPAHGYRIPLLENHEVVHLVSATASLALRKERRAPAAGLLAVVADPVFDAHDARVGKSRTSAAIEADLLEATRTVGLAVEGGAIPRLPFASDEARAIAAAASQPGTLLSGFEAARPQVLEAIPRHRILHFATHAIASDERPELSGLVLSLFDAQGRPRDGFLRLREIYDLKTAADLVVLAGCQTAVGRRAPGYGVIGLTSAFLHAGAARVLSTMWRVDDEATATLMSAFYRGLLTDRLRPSEALRRAQLAVADNPRWRSAYYWAGVLLYGDWGELWDSN